MRLNQTHERARTHTHTQKAHQLIICLDAGPPQSHILHFHNIQYHIQTLTRLQTHEWTEQNYLSFSLSLLDWHQQACQLEHPPSSAQMWAWPLSPI